jgi:hypothetical protein
MDGHFSQGSCDPSPPCGGCDVTRGPVRPLVVLRSRRPLPLFCLAPHRVFRAPSVTLGAVGSYPAFSPLPRSCDQGGFISVTLSVDRDFHPGLPRVLRGMPPCGVRTFLEDCSPRSSTVTMYQYALADAKARVRKSARRRRDAEMVKPGRIFPYLGASAPLRENL